METNISSTKYRKHTHLAKDDVQDIIIEKGSCVVTIKLAFYERNVNVNGKKQDNYFLSLEEDIPDMIANSGKRKIITKMAAKEKNLPMIEAKLLSSWTGLKLNLLADDNVMFGTERRGGIVIDQDYNQPIKLTFEQAKAEFEAVSSRETFVIAMTRFKDFMSNPEIVAICTSLAAIYPNPAAK